MTALRASRYHVAKQSDGRGRMLLRLIALGSPQAVVMLVNLAEETARSKLAEYRRVEAYEQECWS